MKTREVLYASPAVASLDTDAAEVATITMNQSATVDLDRICALAVMNAIAANALYPEHSFAAYLDVGVNSKLKGSDPLVVGRNTPAGAINLCPTRTMPRRVRFGRHSFASQDTIAIEATIRGTAITADFSIAAPGTSSLESPDYRPRRPPQLLCSPTSGNIAADDATDTLTITADRAGWAYVTGLAYGGVNDAVAASEETGYTDGLLGCTLTSLTLPGNIELIRGVGTPEAPLGMLSDKRAANWVDFGWVYLNAGSTITAGIRNRGTDIMTVSGSIPFFEDDNGPGPKSVACPPRCC